MKTFKALGALLAYPEAEWVAALDEIEAVFTAEDLLSNKDLLGVRCLINTLRHTELMALQESYVELFDHVPSLSLHLFEHVHGESRDRGQAMVDLNQLYAGEGLLLAGNELPDFLPAFLEYLSLLPYRAAVLQLEDAVKILDGMAARLAQRGSHYAAVFNALLRLAGQNETHAVTAHSNITPEHDRAEIDSGYADQPAFGGIADCRVVRAPRQAQVSVIKFDRGAKGAIR